MFRDPVVALDGHSYEREAIEGWFRKSRSSPMTGEVLKSKQLIPNLSLKQAISSLKAKGLLF